MSDKKRESSTEVLGNLLTEAGMQVTVSGWKKELEIAEAEITALKEKIRGLECDFQLDANRAIEYKEKLALAVENLRSIKAEALKNGMGERHRCEHIVSIVNETLAKLGEKMEGKE